MQRRTKTVIAGAAVVGVVAAGTGAAVAVGGDSDTPITGKEEVNIERIEPQGNYAVRISFDDGHDHPMDVRLHQRAQP